MMIRPLTAFTVLLIALSACRPVENPTAGEVIEKAIQHAGGDLWNRSWIGFDFRDRHYEVQRENGLFDMRRFTYTSEDSVWMDKYHNYGFQRFLNDSMVSIPDSMAQRYQASVNSVIYFFSLPYGLQDPAVNADYLGLDTLENTTYHKIKVWFDEEGGGEDHDDQFVYWFNTASFALDYFAYAYQTDGGGIRFREATNARFVDGIKVQDYHNFSPLHNDVELAKLLSLHQQGALKLLSIIENDNVDVRLLNQEE